MADNSSLVHAWRLGYNVGRAEAEAECDCGKPATPARPENLVYLDDYRPDVVIPGLDLDGPMPEFERPK